ncbi:TPA: 50S ribosomal protein L32e [Candidatus Thalassarchaeaceae archaeon]|nr:50S ribosomal protein L32e [Euryarchaeota archaeon]MDG1553991.1 50S ribosomal protein L32e [Candidatus Thalassarchaeaceae archaeon]DAC65222.1 MAG TPA: 50S ribosomal protein L32e [Candidatus Poseidoniales archaeon]MDC0502124.1 50S ribosomal protein L32e [Euryarchaeota archaeon]DAC65459.1 MAG TPA: 50S ribosomal protein L32e [Candidatus Poseidoniales archaeon]|tara:strand:+ start:860 stop:1528 length:669 start_codon:yes stop_codon:yes gene_type:complete
MEEYENMTVAELKELLRGAKLPVSGKKSELIARLIESNDSPEEVAEEVDIEDVEMHEEDDDTFDDDDEEFFDEEWDQIHTARQKPVLDDVTKANLSIRAAQMKKQPKFRRQEWYRYYRLARTGWRKPKGMQSKQRLNMKYRTPMVRVGYGKIAAVRGLHPSGFEDILVNQPSDLDGLDPERQAIRIGAGVGNRKRAHIHDRADDLGLRVLNRRKIDRKGDLK